MRYTHLSQDERYQIYILKKAGHDCSSIARLMKRHKSTISRELQRNRGERGYRPAQAHQQAAVRRLSDNGKRISKHTWAFVDIKLRQLWSPEQICGYLKANGMPSVSHERIYQHIYSDKRAGGTLHKSLRCQKQRKKRYGQRERRGTIVDQVSIEQRPEIVDQLGRFGDWEADLVIGAGQQQALVTLNERKSRYSLIGKVERKTAQEVSDTMITLLTPFADCVHTVTSDNGKEFSQHARIAEDLDAQFFFAHPYCSWERGANENMNGLIRQFFPKKMAFDSITASDVALATYSLNHRPRKCLGFKTPHQVFMSQLQSH
ncbi:IS30 family transposase [Noviherbaspirillum sp. CPCC 100848]|uniref:IS30 family transposase n=1 Tax=Noviherbaspirillum album TaxID=3080276 RepID=A0ABU6JJR5_9BURK|nr:IS30 family transposase [Noviherbaspirillum sp. CPCC 100848]MEC4723909.1 IS30 family transposase [Noviherbaspirillum sp. CPCC 100848]